MGYWTSCSSASTLCLLLLRHWTEIIPYFQGAPQYQLPGCYLTSSDTYEDEG